MFKLIKYGTVAFAGVFVAGLVVFGTQTFSYLRSSAKTVRHAVRSNIPVDFELGRARDLLEDVGPQMQDDIRLIAEQEVDIDAAKQDIASSARSLDDEKARIQKLRDQLSKSQESFTFGDLTYTRVQVKQELARSLDLYNEGSATLDAKRKLREERERSLVAAEQQLEQMRLRKTALEGQIEALTCQYRLEQAAATGGAVNVDSGKLEQAEKLVSDIRKELNVTEHVLAHEARFTQPMAIDTIDEQDLLKRVDQQLGGEKSASTSASH